MISSTLRKAGPYAGNGSTLIFPFSFKVFSASDVQVIATDATGVEVVQTTGFTVALNSNQDTAPGGTVTMAAPPATGTKLTLASALSPLQPMQITNGGGFFPRVLNDSADRAMILIQQLYERVGRTLAAPISSTEPVDGLVLPSATARAGRILVFDAQGRIIAGSSTSGPGDGGLRTDLAQTSGGGLIGFLRSTGATVRSMLAVLLDFDVSVKDFGAVGNGIADDGAAIQAALDYVGARGGGGVRLPAGDYRTTRTLRIPTLVTMRGPSPVRYPFYGVNGGARIVADFPSATAAQMWVVEAYTRKVAGNALIGYNEMVVSDLGNYIPTYNIGVFDLTITAQNTIPFGGLRVHGAPGATVHRVGMSNVGTGFVLNFAFDCDIDIHSMGLYTGAALWDDINACALKIYVAQDYSKPKTIPAAYRLTHKVALDGNLVGAYAMATNAHTTAATGLDIGSTNSLCVNNDLRFTSERYSRGMFVKGVSGLEITRFYCEGAANDVDYAIVATGASHLHIQSLHAFMSGTGTLVDLGASVNMSLSPGGIVTPSVFGTGPFGADGSLLVIHNVPPTPTGVLVPSPRPANIHYPDLSGAWNDLPAAGAGWTNNATYKPQYRISRGQLQLRGFATGGPTGSTAVWTLPVGYRPSQLANIAGGFGSQLSVDTDGSIKISSGAVLGLDGVSIPL